MLIFVFLSSWVTELAGFHALFGAFLAGVVWPRSDSKRDDVAAQRTGAGAIRQLATNQRSRRSPLFVVSQKIQPLATTMLIPLFFSCTGLRTSIGVLGVNLGLIAVAIAGKVGGAFLGARITGFDVRNSLALGFLLNTRGLVELIVLNVGLDLGILSPALFSMMVIMALVTTVITTPC
jgi:Kef-type K+ transport system membrane component KefB